MSEQTQLDLDAFTPTEEVSTQELDRLVSSMVEAKSRYLEAKATSDKLYWEHEEKREQVMALLSKAGKSSYAVDDVGKVTIVDKLKVKFPAAPEDREKFFKWLSEVKGKEALYSYTTVNYNSLNSLYNEEFNQAIESGIADDFEIPGIEKPQHNRELRFTKAR